MAYQLSLPYQARTNAYFEWDDVPADVRYFGLSTNIPLKPENLPDRATRDRGKQTPDIFPMPGLNAVNGRFKALVEEFEPATHLFHPILLKERDGSGVPGEWFIFSARIALDFVLTERSGLAWRSGDGGLPPYPDPAAQLWESHHPDHPKSNAKREQKFGILASTAARGHQVVYPQHLYVSAPAIAGHHLWTGSRVFSNRLWVSDAFFQAFEKAKLKYLVPDIYGFEIDEPWVAENEIAPILDWERAHAH